MKLYTEEQVMNALKLAHSHIKPLQYVIDTLTPIELPSDEEIEKEMTKWGLSDIGQRMGYRLGVKDFCNKLKGGNK